MADHWARHQPVVATEWRADHTQALRRLSLAASAGQQFDRAAELARAAIGSSPLDGRNYAALARALAVAAAPDVGLISIAARRWPLDPAVHAALADHHLREDRLDAALLHLDALLRVRPQSREFVFPLLLELVNRIPDPRPLAEWLAQGMQWRASFLFHAAQHGKDHAPLHRLLRALYATDAPPSDAELRAWLTRLERDGHFVDAWFTWVRSLPPERLDGLGNLFNGSFEWPASGYGFDWRIGRVAGATVGQVEAGGEDGGAALRVAFQHQRVNFRHVSQLLVLPAGAFEFSGRVRLDSLRNEHGLVWVVECAAPGSVRLGSSAALRGASPWRTFGFSFEVPPEACPAQWLRLELDARAAADRFIGGEVWFDDLVIRSARGVDPAPKDLPIHSRDTDP